ncbi:MAG: thioredoxin family protein [Bacteroidales bacterium]|nr:thioredoxin family protein [Bacteroidales bacterium]
MKFTSTSLKYALSNLLLLLLFVIFSFQGKSQVLEPVKWSHSGEMTGKNTAKLTFKATIDEGWYLYSQHLPDGGPIKTSFYFNDLKGFEFVDSDVEVTEEESYAGDGTIIYRVVFKEPVPEEKEDPNFGMVLKLLKKKAEFSREIRILTDQPLKISGFLEYMCCDNEKCLPPTDLEFSFSFKVESPALAVEPADSVDSVETIAEPVKESTLEAVDNATAEDSKPDESSESIWYMFIVGLFGGLLALITPCVFPMIPMTVSYFIRGSGSKAKGRRDAIFYGFSIVVIYVLLGMGISLIFGSDQLNLMATSPIFNIFFFLLLLIFAAAFFGAFELQLPSSWINKMDNQAEKSGGLLGVFLMAFVLVLVSFSCTGPIIGTLLVQAAVSGSWLSPMLGMAGFAVALAIPFTLLAIFPSMLGSMPKSGGWLNSVKVVLAFILVAFSLKFFSVADAVGQWGLLNRETFLAIWITLFGLMGFYLLGKIKFHHDDDLHYVSVPRLFFVIVTFAFTIYLIPGMWGAPLNAISSFAPPITTQEFNLNRVGTGGMQSAAPALTHDYSKYKTKEGAYGLIKFLDYEEGLEYAKTAGRPVFLDFTGLGCANCKKMEQSVWSDPRVLQRLRDEYIIVSLYVDERTALPKEDQFVSDFGGREKNIRTVGAKWSDFQARNYGVNSQPYYVLLDHNEKRLAEPYSFNTDVDQFLVFLDKGIEGFKAGQ